MKPFATKFIACLTFTASALTLAAAPARADATATWKMKDQKEPMVIEYRDDKTMRISTGRDAYMAIVAGRLYQCMKEDGKWKVIDVEKMQKAMAEKMKASGMAGLFAQQMKKQPAGRPHDVKIEKLGRGGSAGGVSGEWYRVTDVDPDTGKKEVSEALMTEDRRITRVWHGWIVAIAKSMEGMGEMFGGETKEMWKAIDEQQKMGMAPIQVKNDMELSALSDGKIADERFTLPAKPETGFEDEEGTAMPPSRKRQAAGEKRSAPEPSKEENGEEQGEEKGSMKDMMGKSADALKGLFK